MRNIYDANHNPIHPNDKDLVLGQCFGVMIEKRKSIKNGLHMYKPGPLIHLMVEDDENWFVKQFSLDSSWIDDMIRVLTEAKKRIHNA